MPATTIAHPSQAQNTSTTPALIVPFTRAAKEHVEQFLDVTKPLSASAQPIGPIDIPAYGFLRGIFVELTATGGAGTVAVAKAADAPFSVVDEFTLIDVNGAPIYGPLSGYETYVVDKTCGYFPGNPDPKKAPDFADVAVGANASGNFSVLLYLPVELSGRDALGALPNMNGASTYKLRLSIAPSSRIYTTAPNTTLPNVQVRAWLNAWTQPTQTDLRGNANATTPPALGTTQYLSKQVFNVAAAGYNNFRSSRVGNLIRNQVFIWRNAAGARVKATFPDPLDISWDTRLLKAYSPIVWRGQMAHRLGFSGTDDNAGALELGVYVEDYCHEFDGKIGYELRDGWLPTTPATRLEASGTFGEPGTLTIITNDVSAAGEVYV